MARRGVILDLVPLWITMINKNCGLMSSCRVTSTDMIHSGSGLLFSSGTLRIHVSGLRTGDVGQ